MVQPSNKRTSKTITFIIIAILGLIAFGLKRCKHSRENYPDRTVTTTEGEWRHHKIIYTSHARCRMECRDISEDEVEYGSAYLVHIVKVLVLLRPPVLTAPKTKKSLLGFILAFKSPTCVPVAVR